MRKSPPAPLFQRGELRVWIAALGLLFALPAPAVVVGDGPFDMLLGQAEVVVRARVSWIDSQPNFEHIAFAVVVEEVLESDGGEVPENLEVEVPFPLWPEGFGVPYRAGEPVILILWRRGGGLKVINCRNSILPAAEKPVSAPASVGLTERLVAELLAFGEATADGMARARCLQLIAEVAGPENAGLFRRHLAGGEWPRRVALAALIRHDPTPEVVEAVISDFRAWLEAGAEDRRFFELYDDLRWAARRDEFRNRPGVAARTLTYRPLYRLLIDYRPAGGNAYLGVEALKLVGEAEDLHRLTPFLDHERATVRFDALEGVARLLEVEIPERPGIPGYTDPLPRVILDWEEVARARVHRALVPSPPGGEG